MAAVTNEGRYCKFIIVDYGYNLKIEWVTYNKEFRIPRGIKEIDRSKLIKFKVK
ncbi:MAG TPA: hypothetical protein VK469_01135 [Candidatus Kapabacteria bacterium]|nr:hypothetical protein [Candidatus Kapabacteria bacterium]